MVFPVIFSLHFPHQLSLCLQAPTGLSSASVSDLLKSLDITAHKRLEPSRLPRYDCNIFTRPPLYSYKLFFKLSSLFIYSCCVKFGEILSFILTMAQFSLSFPFPYPAYQLLRLLEWHPPLTLIYSR